MPPIPQQAFIVCVRVCRCQCCCCFNSQALVWAKNKNKRQRKRMYKQILTHTHAHGCSPAALYFAFSSVHVCSCVCIWHIYACLISLYSSYTFPQKRFPLTINRALSYSANSMPFPFGQIKLEAISGKSVAFVVVCCDCCWMCPPKTQYNRGGVTVCSPLKNSPHTLTYTWTRRERLTHTGAQRACVWFFESRFGLLLLLLLPVGIGIGILFLPPPPPAAPLFLLYSQFRRTVSSAAPPPPAPRSSSSASTHLNWDFTEFHSAVRMTQYTPSIHTYTYPFLDPLLGHPRPSSSSSSSASFVPTPRII